MHNCHHRQAAFFYFCPTKFIENCYSVSYTDVVHNGSWAIKTSKANSWTFSNPNCLDYLYCLDYYHIQWILIEDIHDLENWHIRDDKTREWTSQAYLCISWFQFFISVLLIPFRWVSFDIKPLHTHVVYSWFYLFWVDRSAQMWLFFSKIVISQVRLVLFSCVCIHMIAQRQGIIKEDQTCPHQLLQKIFFHLLWYEMSFLESIHR